MNTYFEALVQNSLLEGLSQIASEFLNKRTFPRETLVDVADPQETVLTQSYLTRIYALLILRLFFCKIPFLVGHSQIASIIQFNHKE